MPTPVRQRILGAALSLIQRRGIEQVTTREIAMAAGAAEGLPAQLRVKVTKPLDFEVRCNVYAWAS